MVFNHPIIPDWYAGLVSRIAQQEFVKGTTKVMDEVSRMISYWQEILRPLPSLVANMTVDVVVVGSGYTGLWTAELLSRRGLTVCILESEQPGWGASGRNGGLVIPGLAVLYPDVVKTVGAAIAETLYRRTVEAQALVREVAQGSTTSVDYAETGSLYLAADPKEWAQLQETKRLLDKIGIAAELIQHAQLPHSLKKPERPGGLFMEADGRVHPLKLIQWLIDRIIARGSFIFGNSRVLRIDESTSGVLVTTSRASVAADHVIIATNARASSLYPPFADHIFPIRGQMLVTTPVAALDYAYPVYADWGYKYWHQRADGRLLIGGWRDLDIPGERGHTLQLNPTIQRALERFAEALVGKPVAIERRWAGTMAFTRDRLPWVGPVGLRTIIAAGFNGHGSTNTVMAAQLMAEVLLDGKNWIPALLPRP